MQQQGVPVDELLLESIQKRSGHIDSSVGGVGFGGNDTAKFVTHRAVPALCSFGYSTKFASLDGVIVLVEEVVEAMARTDQQTGKSDRQWE